MSVTTSVHRGGDAQAQYKAVTVATWCWGEKFPTHWYRRLAAAVKRNLRLPHEFVVIWDGAGDRDFGPLIRTVQDWPELRRPIPGVRVAGGNSQCYRRLRMFALDALWRLGPRILHLDVDTVITGDITPLVDRPEPLVVYAHDGGRIKPSRGVTYNPSMVLFDAGALDRMWQDFRDAPQDVIDRAQREGWIAWDEAVFSMYVDEMSPPAWTRDDGVLFWRKDVLRAAGGRLPDGARVIHFWAARQTARAEDRDDQPCSPNVRAASPWIEDHWRE